MTNAPRAQIDLEALVRDLRREDGNTRAAGKGDPLAELARIVGQDDPFRTLLATRSEPQPAKVEEAGWAPRQEPRFTHEESPRVTPADAFDQYLASVERDLPPYPAADEPAQAHEHPEADASYDDSVELRRAAPRRKFASVGVGLAVVAVAVTGALAYKSMHGKTDGTVLLVQADTTPMKVAPKVADGVEIPDQNRQIYDRNATGKESGQIKVVNREEQPLDVSEAARAAGGSTASQGTTPGNASFDAFGEPRRVRTVSVKPDAPPSPPQQQAEQAPVPVPTMVLPGAEDAAPAAPAPSRGVKLLRQAETTPSAPPSAPEMAAAAPAPKPSAPAKKAPQRVASVSPETMPATSPETTQATSAVDTTSPVGGFSVQLGVRNSASDARAAFHQMQAKYSQLAGKPELIRQAEVNGKTLYRVRVGPLSKEAAASLCTSLQGAGGQCFVAKN